MIKLRWLVRRVKDNALETEKVLQYCQEIDTTVRAYPAGAIWELPHQTKMSWSPWLDVPLEIEKQYEC